MSVSRRDFLKLRTHAGERTVEISCERLYMRWIDTRPTRGGPDVGYDPVDEGDPIDRVGRRPTEQIFEAVEEELGAADVLRLVDRQWLSGEDDELRRRVGRIIEEFRARGGRVEFTVE